MSVRRDIALRWLVFIQGGRFFCPLRREQNASRLQERELRGIMVSS
jgi:hypothetical protein